MASAEVAVAGCAEGPLMGAAEGCEGRRPFRFPLLGCFEVLADFPILEALEELESWREAISNVFIFKLQRYFTRGAKPENHSAHTVL